MLQKGEACTLLSAVTCFEEGEKTVEWKKKLHWNRMTVWQRGYFVLHLPWYCLDVISMKWLKNQGRTQFGKGI
jgi:hypothetical protein